MRRASLYGSVFGRLIAMTPHSRERWGASRVYWKCLCECGRTVQVYSSHLLSGRVNSCGCLRIDKMTTHGFTGMPEYSSWCNMKDRCENKNNDRYKDYGGRGIKVCRRWHLFENFIKDMGMKPTSRHSIDRINNDGNYTPENCKWSTPKEQASNRRKPKNG